MLNILRFFLRENIAREEELGKQGKETEIKKTTSHKSSFIDNGASPMGKNNRKTKNHLKKLNEGDQSSNWVGHPDSHRHERVIRIHNGVDKKIDSGKVESMATGQMDGLVAIPTKQHGHNMMVIVQEDEGFLSKHDEKGIHKLKHLGKIKQEGVKLSIRASKTPLCADGSPPPTLGDGEGDEGEDVERRRRWRRQRERYSK